MKKVLAAAALVLVSSTSFAEVNNGSRALHRSDKSMKVLKKALEDAKETDLGQPENTRIQADAAKTADTDSRALTMKNDNAITNSQNSIEAYDPVLDAK